MGRPKKPRKTINGIEHMKCCFPGCETWIISGNRNYRCREHAKLYYKLQNTAKTIMNELNDE